jgi:hypothetical protein
MMCIYGEDMNFWVSSEPKFTGQLGNYQLALHQLSNLKMATNMTDIK